MLEKRTQMLQTATEYPVQGLITNEDVCRKSQVGTGKCDEVLEMVKNLETETKLVWPHLKHSWLNKGDF